jgi:glycosyltransferase involved in cell wall biosynthesis
MSRVILISPDDIGERMAGPAIRYWNFAQELSKFFQVILFTPNEATIISDEFSIVRLEKLKLKEASKDAQCIILQGLTLWENSYIKKLAVPVIIDLYDPFMLENIELHSGQKGEHHQHRASLSVIIDQLQFGDHFICASEKQKDFWIGMLTVVNRVNPYEYTIDKTMEHLISVVPFGLPSVKPIKTKKVLKGVHPGIEENDKVLIWGGGLWDWLDPISAVQAISLITNKRSDIKLFFMGIKNPNAAAYEMKNITETIALTESLGLRNKIVFFNDWVNYHDRHNYLLECDIGLSLHHNHLETRFSYRTRILDYIWCNLPILTTKGDVMAEYVERYNLGVTVSSANPKEIANAIEYLLDKEKKSENYSASWELTWSECVSPLIRQIKSIQISKGKKFVFGIKGTYHLWQYRLIKVYWLLKLKGVIGIMRKIRKRIK